MLTTDRLRPALLVVALAGCATAGSTPSAAREPAAVRQEIQRRLDEHVADFKRGDPAAVAAIYTDDVIVSPANVDDIRGRAAMEAFLSPLFSGVTFTDLAYQVREVSVRGDTAFAFGTYSSNAGPRGQAAVSDRGRFSTVWVRQPDGSWKIRRSHFNSSVPPAPAAPIAGSAVRQGVEQASRRHVDAWRRNDADAVATMFTDDAILLLPNVENVRGRAAIRAFVANVFSTTKVDRLDVTIEELDLHGDTAYERGSYSEGYTVHGQGAKRERGRYIMVWKQQPGGAWKIHRFLANHPVPPG